jgi:hypothetical protein
MLLVSSKMTFFFKRVLPLMWCFGILLFVIVSASYDIEASTLALLIAAMIIFVFAFWLRVSNLADEVVDAGNALVVRSGGQEERIALSDIKDIKYSPLTLGPARVRLSLRRHTVFGDAVAFCAPVSMVPFWESPVIHDLIDRVDAARWKQ